MKRGTKQPQGRLQTSRPPQPRPGRRRILPVAVAVALVSAGLWAVIAYRQRSASPQTGAAVTNVASGQTGSPSIATPPPTSLTNPAAGTPTGEMNEPDDATQAMNRAIDQLNAGKLAEAIALFEQAVKASPNDEEAHFNLGYAYARAGRIAEAAREYERTLEIFPDHAEAHNNLGNLLVRQQRFGEAMTHYSAVLKLAPDNATALNNVGRCLAEQGKVEESIAPFTDAVRLRTNYVEARCNLGNALLSLGRKNEAVAQFTEALRLAPAFGPAVSGLRRAEGQNR